MHMVRCLQSPQVGREGRGHLLDLQQGVGLPKASTIFCCTPEPTHASAVSEAS